MSAPSITVLGGGESGVGSALLAQAVGGEAWVSDAGALKPVLRGELEAAGIPFEEGGHDAERVLASELVVKSPGIPESAPLVVALRERGVEVVSEIEWASRYATGHVIGITGANGKTTTTALTAHVLGEAGLDVACVGNIGRSWARDLAERRVAGRGDATHHVVEVSSFQLDGCTTFRPDTAILLNITPDHLDRYGYDLTRYADAKWRITQAQQAGDVLTLNADDPISLERWAERGTQARIVAISTEHTTTELRERWGDAVWGVAGLAQHTPEQFEIILPQLNPFIMTIHELALQGKHNLHNSMAASVAGRILELRKEGIRDSLSRFDGIEHRMEAVSTVNGIDFINDSKATNVNSTWYALDSLTGPIVWIAGGVDKGNDYTALMHLVEGKVDHLICLGKDNSKLHAAFGDKVKSVTEVESAAAAVERAYDLAMPGMTVLLSPACASFDLFGSYEERGRAFKAAVRAL
jgi:UDP-N-acetylmuramoylalanine--D-glutamate ligase